MIYSLCFSTASLPPTSVTSASLGLLWSLANGFLPVLGPPKSRFIVKIPVQAKTAPMKTHVGFSIK